MSYSRQIINTEGRHYLVKAAREFFDNQALTDTEVYKILGHVFEELRNSRDTITSDIAGAGLAYIYTNHLDSEGATGEQTKFQTDSGLS